MTRVVHILGHPLCGEGITISDVHIYFAFLIYNFHSKISVVCAWSEPVPGYIDNLNGAGGIAVTTGKGLLHSMPAHANKNGDLVPVDVVCNSLIAIPWAEIKKNNTLVLQIRILKDM